MKNNLQFEITKYPDKSSYVTITEEGEMLGNEVVFKLDSYEDLWHLNQLSDAMRNVNAHLGTTVTIPCMLDAQSVQY